VLEDASPAAKAAAAAMAQSIATVSADNPALQQPEPQPSRFNPAAIVEAFRQRLPLLGKTAAAALLLFGASWWYVNPRGVSFTAIGTNQRLQLVPVDGQATLDGQPLSGARVIFIPRGPRQFRSPEGVVGPDGRYRLQFCEGHRGAPPGRYRVQLISIDAKGRDIIPGDYGEFTQQHHEVGPGGGQIDIRIETKKPK